MYDICGYSNETIFGAAIEASGHQSSGVSVLKQVSTTEAGVHHGEANDSQVTPGYAHDSETT